MGWRFLLAAVVGVFWVEAYVSYQMGNTVATVAWALGGASTLTLGSIALTALATAGKALGQNAEAIEIARQLQDRLEQLPPELAAAGYILRIEDEDGRQIIRFPLSMN